MPGYELRVWSIPFGDSLTPLATERFTADSDGQAIARMREFAAGLDSHRQVYLHAEGRDRSIAAEDGLA